MTGFFLVCERGWARIYPPIGGLPTLMIKRLLSVKFVEIKNPVEYDRILLVCERGWARIYPPIGGPPTLMIKRLLSVKFVEIKNPVEYDRILFSL